MGTKRLFTILAAIVAVVASAGTIGFNGNTREVIDVSPEASTGLHHIYVLDGVDGVTMTYTAASATATVTWQDFSDGGGASVQDTQGVTRTGRMTRLSNITPNHGYIITEGTTPTYVWVTDYSTFGMKLHGISHNAATDDCGTTRLIIDGDAPEIVYYSINGARRVLDRQFKLTYNTLEWVNDSTATEWQQAPVERNLESLQSEIVVPAPLCNTTFTLSGDRFMEQWGEAITMESDNTYVTRTVDCRATAVQDVRENDNERQVAGGEGGEMLGGSAPVHIVFTGHPTDAVVYREWQLSTDAEFETIDQRINADEVDQTFNEAGTFYLRYVVANGDGTCEAISDVFTVNIGVSELLCPNVFSPGSSEGTNDVWKVSYSSIIDFHCWIFNRWGNKVCEFTDPSQGWDGTYHGKLVGAGVYYYVIQATGSDGKKYKLSGDINIIRHKKNPYTSDGDEEGTLPDTGGGDDGGGVVE
ncbi:MAG: gliding motility-associated C-terminal domain-containing protein [Muribaculaceae bacterium]|nr:gliding motility-associated C-terminal domain-containing protein [Muribaculaceae bacterium]